MQYSLRKLVHSNVFFSWGVETSLCLDQTVVMEGGGTMGLCVAVRGCSLLGLSRRRRIARC